MTKQHRLRPWWRSMTRSRWIVLAVVVAALLFLLGSVVWRQIGQDTAQQQTQDVTGQRDATADQAIRAALPVVALCKEQSPVGEALRAAPDDPCGQATKVVADPVPIQGERGPGPTDEQIDAAVAKWLITHPIPPGRGPNIAEITAALAAYLTEHPPEPGRPPSAAEIALEVARWFADHPVRDGRDGDKGEKGDSPTAEEIRAAVAAELAANPPPAGPPGPTCPPGTTLLPVIYANGVTGMGCVSDVQPTNPPATPSILGP